MTEEERREAARRRTARYRANKKAREQAHEKGDHSACRPAECEVARAVAQDVTRDVTAAPQKPVSHREPPAGLGPAGRQLWEGMAGVRLGPTHVLLLTRACRLADRLERLDQLLQGGDWLDVAVQREASDGVLEVRVTVDRALGETRQHEAVLKLLVAELRHAGRPATSAGQTPPAGAPDPAEGDEEKEAVGGNVTSLAGLLGSTRR